MAFEDDLISRGCWPVCGVDEAGRGPLAGPVVAAAVIMAPSCMLRSMVKDSKQLTEKKREQIFEFLVRSDEVCIGVSLKDACIIDEINILQATLKAMEEAVIKLTLAPQYALVDGNVLPKLSCRGIPVIGGDESEPSISAASIIAKVTRDRLMTGLDEQYPGYGFARHKGYPTKAHLEAIRRLGASPVHRRTFRGVC
jgi:ribonuclease HII